MTLPAPGGDEIHETNSTRTASIRRAPRYGVFIGLGAIVGILVTVIVTTSFPADPDVGMWATVAYMSLYGVSAGVALGAVAALIADRVSRRRARVVTVERGAVEIVPEPEPEPEPVADSTADRASPPATDDTVS